jgi:hypothetical protein
MRDIFSYIIEQEGAFTKPIPIESNWYWGFQQHVLRSFSYKHSQFEDDNDDRSERPFKNIVRPMLNLQYRSEGFDVKDIDIYVDNADTYYKSFLLRKYYQKWALKNEMDTFIDDVVESFVDYGGVLVRNTKSVRPEVVDLRSIAFCDQTEILSGAFAIKHFFSPRDLMDMKKSGWGTIGADTTIENLIFKAESAKQFRKDTGKIKTPSKYVEIYEVHNISAMDIDPTSEDTTQMMYIVAFYEDESGQKQGVTLFSTPEPELPFKMLKRDPIRGRALGWGGVEELFEPQIWTNYAEIHIIGMLRQASKVVYLSTDPRFKNQNIGTYDNGSILDIQANADIRQLDTVPRNLTVFENYVVEQHEHAMEMSSASDISLGQQPNSGTPFKSVETQLVENKSLHLWRQGRIAVFIDEIHRDWIIPQLGREIVKGDKFLAELSSDELYEISQKVGTSIANDRAKEVILNGGTLTQEEYEAFKSFVTENSLKAGNKRFVEILKDEFSGEKLQVSTNIAGKQKNLALLTDKFVNVVRQIIATPNIRQDPELVKMLNSILETSGISPVGFASPMAQPMEGGATDGLKQFAQASQPV